jgi:hypothetical protein
LHAPQLETELSDVSQPFAFGAAVLQSAHPARQPVYVQVVPPQAPPMLCTVSQTLPQPPQFAAATLSQPLMSGALVSQLANPLLQLA